MTAIGTDRPDWDPNSPNRTQVSLIDVKRAYFNAVIDKRDKPTFVDLPTENSDYGNVRTASPAHVWHTGSG